jgi:hypothetical protein
VHEEALQAVRSLRDGALQQYYQKMAAEITSAMETLGMPTSAHAAPPHAGGGLGMCGGADGHFKPPQSESGSSSGSGGGGAGGGMNAGRSAGEQARARAVLADAGRELLVNASAGVSSCGAWAVRAFGV